MTGLHYRILILVVLIFAGCERETQTLQWGETCRSRGRFTDFSELPGWNAQTAQSGLAALRHQCETVALPSPQLCDRAARAHDAKAFFETFFRPFLLEGEKGEYGLMTGYYEPLLHGSTKRHGRFRFPLYARPKDLLPVDLGAAYPDLAHRLLRGRLDAGRIVPYFTRAQINAHGVDAPVLCWLDSDVDRFFLHVQGSGRIALDDNRTLFVGHADRNGWPYRSIGKLLVEAKAIDKARISLQSIRAYLAAHPSEKKRILESNPSYIFFRRKTHGATGALGVELMPLHSVAVDRSRIPLGFPLFAAAKHPLTHAPMHLLTLAQDTGSAIKGQVRADLFWGFGKTAERAAGQMKSPLKLWLLVPVALK